jgi:hypothetical protein
MLCMHNSLPESPKWLLMKASQSKSNSTHSDNSVSNILVSVNDGANHGSQNLVEDRLVMSRVYNQLKGMRIEGNIDISHLCVLILIVNSHPSSLHYVSRIRCRSRN